MQIVKILLVCVFLKGSTKTQIRACRQ